MIYQFEMKKSIDQCVACPCLDDEINFCCIKGRQINYKLLKSRPKWCPLEIVKPMEEYELALRGTNANGEVVYEQYIIKQSKEDESCEHSPIKSKCPICND